MDSVIPPGPYDTTLSPLSDEVKMDTNSVYVVADGRQSSISNYDWKRMCDCGLCDTARSPQSDKVIVDVMVSSLCSN